MNLPHATSDKQEPQHDDRLNRLIAEHARDLTALIDQDGSFVYVSHSYLHLLGFDPATLPGSSFFSLLHPLDLQAMMEQWATLAEHQLLGMSLRMRHATGKWHWLEATIRVTTWQGATHLLCVAHDITTSRQAEKAMVRLLNQNELILSSLGEGIFGVDRNGKTTFVNQAAAAMLGWEIGELVGRPIHPLIHHTGIDGDVCHEEQCPMLRPIRDAQAARVAYETFWRKDHVSFPVEYVSMPIREGGLTIGAVVTFRDSTERKRLETQLLQAQKMDSIGRLAGGVAHDFNNLLTAIIGYANLALQSLPLDSDLRSDLAEIEKAGMRAATLTRQLLTFARKQTIETQITNLNALILDMDKLLRRLIGEEIELITLPASDLGSIKADPGQIEQVIVNLAVNARDAMPDGGTLIIQTTNLLLADSSSDHPVELPAGDYVVLSVQDNGTGMTPEVQAHLFEPFFTTKEPDKGTGLGLATCYGIIQQHSGTIAVASSTGQGTRFSVYLPCIQPDGNARAFAATTAATNSPGGQETVLVVEDEPALRAFMSTVLRKQGYTILEAANGEEALDIVQAHVGQPIDLLLSDVVMPRMRGPALAMRLVAIRPEIKIVLTSGYNDSAAGHATQLPSNSVFLAKPFSPAELLRKVRDVLDQ